jgi:hypothetical protein
MAAIVVVSSKLCIFRIFKVFESNKQATLVLVGSTLRLKIAEDRRGQNVFLLAIKCQKTITPLKD